MHRADALRRNGAASDVVGRARGARRAPRRRDAPRVRAAAAMRSICSRVRSSSPAAAMPAYAADHALQRAAKSWRSIAAIAAGSPGLADSRGGWTCSSDGVDDGHGLPHGSALVPRLPQGNLGLNSWSRVQRTIHERDADCKRQSDGARRDPYDASRPRMLVLSRDMSLGVSTISSKKCGLCGRPSDDEERARKASRAARHQGRSPTWCCRRGRHPPDRRSPVGDEDDAVGFQGRR